MWQNRFSYTYIIHGAMTLLQAQSNDNEEAKQNLNLSKNDIN